MSNLVSFKDPCLATLGPQVVNVSPAEIACFIGNRLLYMTPTVKGDTQRQRCC